MLTICIWYSLPIRKVIAMQFQLFGPCPKGENGCVIFFFLYLYIESFLKLCYNTYRYQNIPLCAMCICSHM